VGEAVFNGDFEQVPLNAGFDWRATPLRDVAVDFQAPRVFRGNKAVRVDFTVNQNEEYEILSQIVPVAPLRNYRLEAYVRSESITSDSGPRLRILDFVAPARLDVSTSPVLGTTDWHPVVLTFSTGPTTRLVRLAVWRPRSRRFPTEISGSFWIDAISLRARGPEGEQANVQQLILP
jgi:hypothetical protein